MNMKLMIGVSGLVAALGFWAGVAGWRSAVVMTQVRAGLAILYACNLIFCLWLWYRAKPGSGDVMVLPGLVVVLAAMLVGVLPQLLWPAAEGLSAAASITSALVVITMLIMQVRRRRSLRDAGRSV
jgi:FtsH-binding integral membrane protein